jgi:copper chaperone CopZ
MVAEVVSGIMVRHRFRIDGMTCMGCEAVIKREISAIEDVEQVEVDHETGIVEFTTTTAATGSYIEQAVNDLGYDVTEYETR